MIFYMPEPSTRGGMWVELGYANAWLIPTIICVPNQADHHAEKAAELEVDTSSLLNIFAYLPQIKRTQLSSSIPRFLGGIAQDG